MGCDIHVYCEVKEESGQWRTADRFKFESGEYWVCPIYDGRHYALFTALATDVRRRNDETPSLGEAKGLPADMSSQTKAAADYWECNAHNHSYFKLSELYAFQDKHKTVTHSGYISPQQAKDLENGVIPQAWCQGTSDETWVHRTWTEEYDVMAEIVSAIEARAKDEFWLFYHEGRIPQDKADRIRIVFWFDN